MVQFDVSAADVAVANVYAAAMTDSLTGPAMVQCLQVIAFQALEMARTVNSWCDFKDSTSQTTTSKLLHTVCMQSWMMKFDPVAFGKDLAWHLQMLEQLDASGCWFHVTDQDACEQNLECR